MTKKQANKAGDAEKVDTDKAETPTAENEASPQNDPEDHGVSPQEMVAMHEGVTGSMAEAAAKSEGEEKAVQPTIHERLARSGYVLNEDQISGRIWVGESVQCSTDPRDEAAKGKTRITSIAQIAPRRGLTVKPKDGEPFVVSGEFDRDAEPKDWFAVMRPDGSPFLANI